VSCSARSKVSALPRVECMLAATVRSALSSRKEQILRRVPEDLCRSCHNQERDPDFDCAKAGNAIRHW